MLLRLIGDVTERLHASPVFQDMLWDLDSTRATRMDLVMFHARMTSHGLSKQAIEALDVLQGEAIQQIALGRLQQASFLGYNGKPRRMLTDDLIVGLNTLPAVMRQAALYALEAQQPAARVQELTWAEVLKSRGQTPLMIEIIRQRNCIRHIRLPYVFWSEVMPGIDAALWGLEEGVERAFERPWDNVLSEYQAIAQIHQRSEVESFLSVTRNAS